MATSDRERGVPRPAVGRPSLADTRRPQILRAFEECVLTYGLEGSSLETIAREAGVKKSLIRHYFGNRAELTQALIERIVERSSAEYRDVVTAAAAEGGLDALLRYLAGPSFADERDDALIDALTAVAHRDPDLRAQLRRMYAGVQRAISQQLRREFPEVPSRRLTVVAYALLCLSYGNASMLDLGLPTRQLGDASGAARAIVDGLIEG